MMQKLTYTNNGDIFDVVVEALGLRICVLGRHVVVLSVEKKSRSETQLTG